VLQGAHRNKKGPEANQAGIGEDIARAIAISRRDRPLKVNENVLPRELGAGDNERRQNLTGAAAELDTNPASLNPSVDA
jgi:hypothetical protein